MCVIALVPQAGQSAGAPALPSAANGVADRKTGACPIGCTAITGPFSCTLNAALLFCG
jgi:hypothetical protein